MCVKFGEPGCAPTKAQTLVKIRSPQLHPLPPLPAQLVTKSRWIPFLHRMYPPLPLLQPEALRLRSRLRSCLQSIRVELAWLERTLLFGLETVLKRKRIVRKSLKERTMKSVKIHECYPGESLYWLACFFISGKLYHYR